VGWQVADKVASPMEQLILIVAKRRSRSEPVVSEIAILQQSTGWSFPQISTYALGYRSMAIFPRLPD
jgi:hypothetical protein